MATLERMAKQSRVPDALVRFLPRGDHRAQALAVDHDRWLVAARYALILVGAEGVEDSGMWYEVQHVRWEGETQLLRVAWVDPGRTPLEVRTETTEPSDFMADVTAKVTHALVVQKTAITDIGTRVTASVRRREDDELFSTLVADGPLDAQGKTLADELERTVREGVGLE